MNYKMNKDDIIILLNDIVDSVNDKRLISDSFEYCEENNTLLRTVDVIINDKTIKGVKLDIHNNINFNRKKVKYFIVNLDEVLKQYD